MRRWDMQGRFIGRAPIEVGIPESPPPPDELSELISRSPVLSACTPPINVLVSDNRRNGRSGPVSAHLLRTELPPDALVPISSDVTCSSPEFLAVQMASSLTDLELVILLSELLGTYAICPKAGTGMFVRKDPLLTPDQLVAFLDALEGATGTAKVRRALSVACVNSASPMETKLSLRLGLKPARGGYGLEVLSMNEPLEVERVQSLLGKGVRRPDILLRKPVRAGGSGYSGVAVEYNGGVHENDQQVFRDIRRSNELKAIGLKEYEVSSLEYKDLEYMDWLATKIRSDLGMPKQQLSRREATRRRELREGLCKELTHIDSVTWDGKKRVKEREERH